MTKQERQRLLAAIQLFNNDEAGEKWHTAMGILSDLARVPKSPERRAFEASATVEVTAIPKHDQQFTFEPPPPKKLTFKRYVAQCAAGQCDRCEEGCRVGMHGLDCPFRGRQGKVNLEGARREWRRKTGKRGP